MFSPYCGTSRSFFKHVWCFCSCSYGNGNKTKRFLTLANEMLQAYSTSSVIASHIFKMTSKKSQELQRNCCCPQTTWWAKCLQPDKSIMQPGILNSHSYFLCVWDHQHCCNLTIIMPFLKKPLVWLFMSITSCITPEMYMWSDLPTYSTYTSGITWDYLPCSKTVRHVDWRHQGPPVYISLFF